MMAAAAGPGGARAPEWRSSLAPRTARAAAVAIAALAAGHALPGQVADDPFAADDADATEVATAIVEPWRQQFRAGLEWVDSDGIDIQQLSAGAVFERTGQRIAVEVSFDNYDLLYRPGRFDNDPASGPVDETRSGAVLNYEHRLGERWVGQASAGVYEGFTDYRSAWLNEFYRRDFDFEPVYENADPGGASAGLGLGWEYRPLQGFARFDISFAEDRIAPSYDHIVITVPPPIAVRARDRIRTLAYHLELENIPHPRLRTLNEVFVIDTTDREKRYSFKTAANLALGDRWVLRADAGYTRERPGMIARFAGASAQVQLGRGWSLATHARYYEDTGDIDNSLRFSTAAPPADNLSAGLALRWGNENVTVRGSWSRVRQRYEPFEDPINFSFENLYRSRYWNLLTLNVEIPF